MDEHLERSSCLVYYQVSGEPGIAGYSCRSDICLGGMDLRAIFAVCLDCEIILTAKFSQKGLRAGGCWQLEFVKPGPLGSMSVFFLHLSLIHLIPSNNYLQATMFSCQ